MYDFFIRILGMYTTLVLVAGKMLRGYFAGSALKIMFDDLPNVDRILQVSDDNYRKRNLLYFRLAKQFLYVVFRKPCYCCGLV